jgi:hypothetical protein
MHNRDTEGADHPPSTLAAFDEKKLKGDVLSAISRLLTHGEEFSGHDHRAFPGQQQLLAFRALAQASQPPRDGVDPWVRRLRET